MKPRGNARITVTRAGDHYCGSCYIDHDFADNDFENFATKFLPDGICQTCGTVVDNGVERP